MPKTVLITGCSSGIGRATAEFFARKGWNVAATMRDPSKETSLGSLQNVTLLPLDVTKVESVKSALAQTIEKFGAIDAVVNNAGYAAEGVFEKATDAQVRRQFETNVFGAMSVIREILPHFRQRKTGVIVNITSIGGMLTFPNYTLYHGTKWAMEGFSESLAYELRPFGIRVKTVEPGPIKTDFYSRSADVLENSSLSVYDAWEARVRKTSQGFESAGAPPEVVAKTIYRAANSKNGKLRYSPDLQGGLMLLMRRILPFPLFRAVVRMVTGA